MKTPVLSFAGAAGVSGTRYLAMVAGLTAGWQATNGSVEIEVAVAGTFRNQRVMITNAPGTGNSWTYKLFVNGADSTLSSTVSDLSTTASDTTHGVHVNVGDKVCWKEVSSGTPAASGGIAMGCEFEGDVSGESILFGVGNTAPTTGTQYAAPISTGGFNATENTRQIVAPTAGVIDLFHCLTSAGQGSGGSGISRTFTLRLNGVDTSLSVLLSEAATSGSDLSALHAVTVAAGDVISVGCTVAGGTANAANAKFCFRFKPTIDGESILASYGTPSSSAATYENANGNGTSTTETTAYNLAPIDFVWRKMVLNCNAAQGAGKKFDVVSRVNGVSGALAATLANATAASDNTNSVAVVAGQALNLMTTPTGTPTSPGSIRYSSVAYIAPPSGGGSGDGFMMGFGV